MSPKTLLIVPRTPEAPVLTPDAGLTIEQFLAFAETRPNHERWELIEGKVIMQASPTKPHQLIAGNIGGLLWSQRRSLGARWLPMPGVGTIVPASPRSLPQPDFMVLEHPLTADDYSNTTEDALVLFEVISRSNKKADRDWRRPGGTLLSLP